MTPKTRKTREFRQKRLRLIDPELRDGGGEKEERDRQNFASAPAAAPLKMRSASPATKATKIVTLTQGAYSRLCSISFEARRRRVLPEASPRFTSRVRVQEVEHGAIFAPSPPVLAGDAVLLVGVDDGTDKLVPNDVLVIEINESDSGHILERLERFDQAGAFVRAADRSG